MSSMCLTAGSVQMRIIQSMDFPFIIKDIPGKCREWCRKALSVYDFTALQVS